MVVEEDEDADNAVDNQNALTSNHPLQYLDYYTMYHFCNELQKTLEYDRT